MPIHLHPDSAAPGRRAFLQTSILTAAAVIANPDAAEAAQTVKPERWALLSDTHIDANPETEARGVKMADHLRRVLAEVLAERDGLDGIIINGDCAYNEGLAADYATLAELLGPVREAGVPVHFTLGNHDDRAKFLEAFAASGSAVVDGKQVSVVEGSCANWVFLDSLRFVNKVEGEFGEAQLAWLRGYLEANPSKPVILVGHHYPQVFRDDIIPSEQKIQIAGLVDSEAFLELANGFPQAKVYIYGHSHDWRVTPDKTGVHEVNLPPTAYVFSPARPNGWVRATVETGGMTLELRALDPAHPEHGKPVTLAWRA